jgi:cytoskeletal protein RodZ
VEPIGLILQEKRKKRKLTLETISKRTKIGVRYLKALEREDWDVFPAPVYALAFLRSYANFLELDSGQLVWEYKKHHEKPNGKPSAVKKLPPRTIRYISPAIFPVIIGIVTLIAWSGWFLFFRSPAPFVAELVEEEKVPLTLKASAREEVWVSVIIDKDKEIQELLHTGDLRIWEAEERIDIKVGNTRGIVLEMNGEPVELTRKNGQVTTRTFRKKEEK